MTSTVTKFQSNRCGRLTSEMCNQQIFINCVMLSYQYAQELGSSEGKGVQSDMSKYHNQKIPTCFPPSHTAHWASLCSQKFQARDSWYLLHHPREGPYCSLGQWLRPSRPEVEWQPLGFSSTVCVWKKYSCNSHKISLTSADINPGLQVKLVIVVSCLELCILHLT